MSANLRLETVKDEIDRLESRRKDACCLLQQACTDWSAQLSHTDLRKHHIAFQDLSDFRRQTRAYVGTIESVLHDQLSSYKSHVRDANTQVNLSDCKA